MKIRRTPLFIASFFLFFGIFSYTSAQSTGPFQRNLSVGTSGQDVLQLQKILNENPITQIARSGPGSPGQETTYFGGLTQTAVIVFQQIHSADVLAPAGLSVGNGFVGPLTRAALNTIVAPSTVQNSQTNQSAISSSTAQNNTQDPFDLSSLPQNIKQYLSTLQVFSVIPFITHPGAQVTLLGSGFMELGNTIEIGNIVKITNATATDPTKIVFNLPSTIPQGVYSIGLENTNGVVGMNTSQAKITITNQQIIVPIITTVSPQQASVTDTVTVIGSGFTTNNLIATSFGIINNVSSSDGKTLAFSLSSLDNIKQIVSAATSLTGAQVQFYIVNNGGMSNLSSFILK